MITDAVFDPELDFPNRQPTIRYLILSLPRTGSSLLADALCQTGLAGVPLEYFNEELFVDQTEPVTFEGISGYFENVLSRRTTPNGVFGIKIHFYQFAKLFMNDAGLSEVGRRFISSFSKVILMHRRDIVLQAISNLIALETGKWNSYEQDDANKSTIVVDDGKMIEIANHIAFMLSDLNACRDLVQNEKMNYIEVLYEDLINSYNSEVDRVLKFLGLPSVVTHPETVKLGGMQTDLARDMFLSKIGARELFDG